MLAHSIPDELWLAIFDYAADDAALLDHSLPTALSESMWFKTLYGEWGLRTAQEIVNFQQRQSYITKKAIMGTCRTWRRLGYEYLYRFLFLSNPRSLQSLCAALDKDTTQGRWTKRLHITRYYSGAGATMEDMQNALVSIVRHCPHLEIFIVNWPVANTFSAIADALCTYSRRSLRTLQINVPTTSLKKLIFMLQSLTRLVVVHIELDGAPPEYISLGAAGNITFTLPHLRQLSLRGPFQEFIEQATDWELPSLRVLSLDFSNYRNDLPDLLEFFERHGAELTFLDINCIPSLDVPSILDLCPLLTTFTFNPDWRIPATGTAFLEAPIVRRPHQHITTIGCHQLLYAFGVGYAATYSDVDPVVTQVIRRCNDLNFAALNKRNFPRLQRVRVLNTTLLCDLEANNGPSAQCFERWERWSKQCTKDGVRLEDCMGALLGTLPMDSDDEGDEEDEESETDEEAEEDVAREKQLSTLRDLLAECRKMNAQREREATTLPMLRMLYGPQAYHSSQRPLEVNR